MCRVTVHRNDEILKGAHYARKVPTHHLSRISPWLFVLVAALILDPFFPIDLKKKYSASWAVVTGASSGVHFCPFCLFPLPSAFASGSAVGAGIAVPTLFPHTHGC